MLANDCGQKERNRKREKERKKLNLNTASTTVKVQKFIIRSGEMES